MRNFGRLLAIGLFVIFSTDVRAQTIDSMMNVYAENFPQEKIHIHFDKMVYNPGETIWYKAYLFTGADPSGISRNFFAELFDADGNLLQRKTAPVMESTAAGSFDLPAALAGKFLHFRAYTTYMMNFDTAFYFNRDIRILQPNNDSALTQNSSPASHIQFFPEGGDLIAGVDNFVAFKATDDHGLPINVKGKIRDASGKDILDFSSVHDGMGKFQLTPDKADQFTAFWKDSTGRETKTELPAVKPTGIAIKAYSSNKKVYFSVSRSPDSIPDLLHLTIIAHMHQHLVYKAKINLEEVNLSGGFIPVEQLPTGVLQITVFNAANLPIAERVVFVNNHEYSFPVSLNQLSKGVSRRGRNVIDVDVPDTLKSSLSIAITDADADGENVNDPGIYSTLLLSGDVRGYIHHPGYYFSRINDTISQHLDLVMLTHGWRRFKWDQLALKKLPQIKFPEQDYLAVRVEVLGVIPSRISKEESISVILRKKDSSTQMFQVPHLSSTKFGVSGLQFYDTARIYYQFNMSRNLSNEAAVTFVNGLPRPSRTIKAAAESLAPFTPLDTALLRRNRFYSSEAKRIKAENLQIKTLESVTVRARGKSESQKLEEKYTTGLFSGGDAIVFNVEGDPLSGAQFDIFNYLQGKVAGLQINSGGANGPTLQWRGSAPTLYLNEVQIDAGLLQSTQVSEIAMVKVFRPGSMIGFGGSPGGAIAVYTKKGTRNKNADFTSSLDKAILPGYSSMKQFYAPDYIQNPPPDNTPDLRTTLYWRPYLLFGRNTGKTQIEFFNNDVTRRIRIVIEGINVEGKLAHIEKIIE